MNSETFYLLRSYHDYLKSLSMCETLNTEVPREVTQFFVDVDPAAPPPLPSTGLCQKK